MYFYLYNSEIITIIFAILRCNSNYMLYSYAIHYIMYNIVFGI